MFAVFLYNLCFVENMGEFHDDPHPFVKVEYKMALGRPPTVVEKQVHSKGDSH